MLFKFIIIAALLHEFSCDNEAKDQELLYQALIVPDSAGAEDSCEAVLIHSNYLLGFFPCIENLFAKYKNVSLKVLAGLKVFPGFNGDLKGYDQNSVAVDYMAGSYSETAIVEVKEPFKESEKVKFATLPAKGEKICEKPKAVVLYISKQKSRWWWFVACFVVGFIVGAASRRRKRTLALKDEYRGKHYKARKIKNWGKYEPPEIKKYFQGNINGFSDTVPAHVCKKHNGWPVYCGSTIWGFQADCKQSQTRAGGFDLEMNNINDDLDFIARQTGVSGVKVKNSQETTSASPKEKAKSSAFIPRVADEILLLIVVCRLLKIF